MAHTENLIAGVALLGTLTNWSLNDWLGLCEDLAGAWLCSILTKGFEKCEIA